MFIAVFSLLFIIVGLFIVLSGNDSDTTSDPNQQEPAPVDLSSIVLPYDTSPMIGDANAPVKLIKFGDFKCPSCAKFSLTHYEQIKSDYIDTGKVAMYFMNLQFLKDDSKVAGRYGDGIYRQNNEAFWDYYKSVYEIAQVKQLNEEVLSSIIDYEHYGINLDEVKAFAASAEAQAKLDSDLAIADAYGIKSVPSFIINGSLVEGPSYELLIQKIEAELKK